MSSVVALTELLTINTGGSPVSPTNPLPVSVDGFTLADPDGLPVVPANITGKFRETFETFTPGVNWNLTTGSGDIVQTDGNAVSASYLVISKDPLTPNTETILTYNGSFPVPIETAVGLSMSQRVLGQELSMELVSTETALTPPADINISSISQTTTTLTVNTATAHGLVPGVRIGIYGCADSRLNYPSLVVATTPNSTQFTATAGPGGTIPSVTLSGGAQGYVYFRSALGYARNGMSEIFENATATNASVYLRSASGDALPSGTAAGNQSLTVATTASVQAINSPYTYSFLPTSEFRLNLQADRAQAYDASVDATSSTTSRQLRTQVVPDPTKQYTLRFRMTNVDALTVPTAKIVSAAKSASTTATITTAAAHGLTVNDYVVIYGIRDQTNFANQTSQVQVASIISSTQFTVVFGASATATSYGGMVARVQGANVPAAFQAQVGITVQSSATDVTLTGSGTWAVLIGDYVNLYGCRDNSTGADLGLDGAYRVVSLATNVMVLEPLTGTTLPSPVASQNCGGAVIKRTDARISFVRIFEYVRERVEVMPRPSADQSVALPVSGTISAAQSGSWNTSPISNNTYTLATSTNLGSSATYTQTAVNLASSTTAATVYPAQLVIGVQHTAGLTPGQLYLDLGTETSSTAPTTWYTALAVPIPSNANWQQFSVPISTRYYRLRFVNGATAQTSFRLSTFSTYNGGGLSNQYSFPINLQFPLSTTALAANATFTSVSLDFGDTMNVYQTITALAFSDQASASNGFQIQISRDNTNWRVAQQTSVTANTLTSITAHLSYRYARIVYTNGATLQGSFNLDAHADAQ